MWCNVFLETERLLLRRFTEEDADLLRELDSNPEVMRYAGQHALPDAGAYRERIRAWARDYYANSASLGFWALIEKASGAFLGWHHLHPDLHSYFAVEAGYQEGDLDLGYRLRRPAWGKGYATEMARALVRMAFTQLEAQRVVASALTANVASWRVLEKAGLKRGGTYTLPDSGMQAFKYASSRAEWERDERQRA